ncbi:MAG: hypothetical protein KGH98_00175 [Candidatus Micrarchaeota archaeon]|nr:hypothetical protein [Candidatus Micrarchaeota archaeon]
MEAGAAAMARTVDVKPAPIPIRDIAKKTSESMNRHNVEPNLRKIRNIHEAAKNIAINIHLSPEDTKNLVTIAPICFFYSTMSQLEAEPTMDLPMRYKFSTVTGSAFVQAAFTLTLVDKLFNTGLDDISYSSVYAILKRVIPQHENVPNAKFGPIKKTVLKGVSGNHTELAGFFRYVPSFAESMHPEGKSEGLDNQKVHELLRLIIPQLNSKEEATELL